MITRLLFAHAGALAVVVVVVGVVVVVVLLLLVLLRMALAQDCRCHQRHPNHFVFDTIYEAKKRLSCTTKRRVI